jgi:ABC-2 type transport system permease protein
MNWRRLVAMTRKEMVQIVRDWRSLAIVVAMPLVLMLVYGYGVSFDTKHLPLCIFDREGSQKSQDFLKHFQASIYFNVVQVVEGYPALVQAIDAARCRLGIVIPHDFSQQLNKGGPVGVQALLDASDNNTANLGINYSQAVIQAYSQQVRLDWLQRHGYGQIQPSLSVDARTWFNENLESMANIVPGVVAVVMAVIGTFLTALTIAREWERGTMEQLISTPVTASEVMLGKLIPYFVIGLMDTFLCAAIGVWWFGVPFRGQWSVFFVSSGLFLTAVLSTGYYISVLAKSQLGASRISMIITSLPVYILSGFIYPIDQMPPIIRLLTYLFPARFFMSIIRDVFLKGTPLTLMLDDLFALAIFALLLAFLATRAFKKRLA